MVYALIAVRKERLQRFSDPKAQRTVWIAALALWLTELEPMDNDTHGNLRTNTNWHTQVRGPTNSGEGAGGKGGGGRVSPVTPTRVTASTSQRTLSPVQSIADLIIEDAYHPRTASVAKRVIDSAGEDSSDAGTTSAPMTIWKLARKKRIWDNNFSQMES
ncbi:hypothetical protein BDK51DRAFT_27775 [Blyttiomyces helicus]|uniref:Uncharacterized protein n=1 Tax=Blyttiomyces helicus TaxID=388810 RepID=A0A4V1IS66_9FUNG|nr:hypothetical protein BDK51DRAFT_27775 [Blyttiomyces helicus]|eukprot:RKO92487.1 hypothetical protein BDK51DRAFT_27775 [Blyttiomyces helicus]